MTYCAFEDLFGSPVEIGKWFPYNSYINREQISLQRNNLVSTELYNVNDFNDIKFVPTKIIKIYNDDIMDIQGKLKITDTNTALENEAFYTAKIEGAKTTLIRARELHRGSIMEDWAGC